MTPHSATGLLAVVSSGSDSEREQDPAGASRPVTRSALVRPADLVSALTGVALCFFSLFVFAIVQWQYVGPDIERAGVLGWLTPLLAGAACIIASAASVAARLALHRSAERDDS